MSKQKDGESKRFQDVPGFQKLLNDMEAASQLPESIAADKYVKKMVEWSLLPEELRKQVKEPEQPQFGQNSSSLDIPPKKAWWQFWKK
jgi:hypothetical protein